MSDFIPSEAHPDSVRAVQFTTVGKLKTSADDGTLTTLLSSIGLTDKAHVEGFRSACARLLAAGVAADTRAAAFWVPGRIEVVGKHTDYAGGRSLLCAVTKGFAVVSADRQDAVCRVLASFELAGMEDEASVTLAAAAADGSSARTTATTPDGWARYPAVAARRLSRNFGISLGADIAFSCDLPEASGMSSSSAVVIVTFLALAARNDLASSKPEFTARLASAEALCHYLGCIENGQDCGPELPGDAGVGTFGGSEDHTAILLCRANEMRQYAYCPTRLEKTVSFPSEWRIVVAVSGATAQKGAERLRDYNDAVVLARQAAAAAIAAPPPADDDDVNGGEGHSNAAPSSPQPPLATLAALVAETAGRLSVPCDHDSVQEDMLTRIARHGDGASNHGAAGSDSPAPAGALTRRFAQFFEESEVIVPRVTAAIAASDASTLGPLVDRSQQLTESHLRNTLDETEWLPVAARRHGAIAASVFGAGFGGSVWALSATADAAERLRAAWRDEYFERFPERKALARFFVMSPGPGACSVVA